MLSEYDSQSKVKGQSEVAKFAESFNTYANQFKICRDSLKGYARDIGLISMESVQPKVELRFQKDGNVKASCFCENIVDGARSLEEAKVAVRLSECYASVVSKIEGPTGIELGHDDARICWDGKLPVKDKASRSFANPTSTK